MNSALRGGGFFRTIVLMGGSVAIGCDGMAQLVPGEGAGGSTSGGATGSGGASGGTAPTASGGASSGGASSGGASSGGASGGDLGMGGECPTAQLNCVPPNPYSCNTFDSEYLVLPATCPCDRERPQEPSDCDAGDDFVCLAATQDAQGNVLDPIVAFNCECVPGEPLANCHDLCNLHSGSAQAAQCNDPGGVSPDLRAYLCGCAMTTLK